MRLSAFRLERERKREFGNGLGRKAKIELCVTRQIFEVKISNINKDRTNPRPGKATD
jgi:hypothetical protein